MVRRNDDAFAGLVRPHVDRLYRTAILLTGGDHHRSEEPVQTALVKLYARRGWHRPERRRGPQPELMGPDRPPQRPRRLSHRPRTHVRPGPRTTAGESIVSGSNRLDQQPEDLSIRARLQESMEYLHADSDRLLDTASQTGRLRRRHRHRRVSRAVAAGAILAVTGAGSYALATGPGGPLDDRTVVAAPPPPSPTSTPVPTASASTTLAPTPIPGGTGSQVAAARQLPARVAALYLRRLAPAGEFSDFEGQESSDALYAALMIDRGHFYSCQQRREATSCDSVTRGDGSTLMRTTERVGNATVATADYLAPDGTRIVVMTGNTNDLKYGGRVRQGLSADQAAAIATDPVWSLYTAPSDADTADARRLITPWTLIPG